jgi:hypothetical protein
MKVTRYHRDAAREVDKGHEEGVADFKEFRDSLGVEEGDIFHAHVEDGKIVFTKPGLLEPGQPVGKRACEEVIEELEEVRVTRR